MATSNSPDFEHPPHELPSLYDSSAMLLLCDNCGYWEIVSDVPEQTGWRSDRTLPCKCQICATGTVDAVGDDTPLAHKIL